MPQLIAMVIVVVGAMIYMFQTFGGTGDKIEGIAQKTSVMTEINNIYGDLLIAVKAGEVTSTTTLKDLANLGYFSTQINQQLTSNTDAVTATFEAGELNTYSAISFGGNDNPAMLLTLVGNPTNPGIRVRFIGSLDKNKTFLEGQIGTDLVSLASIDRTTTNGALVALDSDLNVPAANRPSSDPANGSATAGTATANLGDGIFTVYYREY